MAALAARDGGLGFTPEGIGQPTYERIRSREPGTLLRPDSINRELAQVALSVRHIALPSFAARIAIQTSVVTALVIEQEEDAKVPESLMTDRPTVEERVTFALEYVEMLQGKLQLTQQQRQTALSLSPAQLDTVDTLLQVIQLEQPTPGLRNGRNVPPRLVTLIQNFLDNPPSDAMLQLTSSMYRGGLVFLAHDLSDDQIRELLLTPEGDPSVYAKEIAKHMRENESFILELSPEGAYAYSREISDGRTIDEHYPVHDWTPHVLPLPTGSRR